MLPLALLLVAALFGSSAAQYTTCIQQGYNLTALTGADLLYTGGGSNWAIRPCGVVTTAGFCTDFAAAGGGEFCQGSTTVSAYNTSNTQSGIQAGLSATWAQVNVNGQYGVAQFLQDGTYCGVIGADREGTIEFVCNTTATTPFISSITELTTCHYQAIVQTSVVCGQVPATGFSQTQGTAIISSTCGAGIYDLTQLNQADIVSSGFGYNWNIRPCGTVSGPSACNLTTNPTVSICQSGFVLATYAPALNPVIYQYLAPGALSQIIQDGAGCANQNRVTNVTYYCNQTAVTPYLAAVVESPICHYALNVQTNQVCGSAFSGAVQPSTSSSGAARAASSSSSTGSVVVQSTGSVNPNPGQSSTAAAPPTVVNSASSTSALSALLVLAVSALSLLL